MSLSPGYRRSRSAQPRGSWVEPSEWRERLEDGFEHLLSAAAVALLAVIAAGLGLRLAPLVWPVCGAVVVGYALPGVARAVLLALGLAQAAALLAWADRWSWRRDPGGGWAATLAQGLLRDPGNARLAQRLDRWLADPARVVTPGAVLAAGIRSLAEGDLADGRRLLRLVAEFDTSRRSPLARRWAVDLLAASAAAEGDLERMVRELDAPRVPQTRFGELLRLCAARARGEPVSERQLRAAWFLAGAGVRTWPLVERVVGAPPQAASAAASAENPLQHALVATARLFGEAPPPRDAIDDAAQRWDRALGDPELPGGALGAARVRAEVVGLLSERLATCREQARGAPRSPILREATWRCGAELDERLQWLSDEIGTRTDQRRGLPLLDEVRAWAALVDAYRAVLDASPERASSSFAKLYYPAVRHTVWLHNDRKQPTLANAMYRVELRYAELVQHDSGVPLLEKNLRCGP